MHCEAVEIGRGRCCQRVVSFQPGKEVPPIEKADGRLALLARINPVRHDKKRQQIHLSVFAHDRRRRSFQSAARRSCVREKITHPV